MMEADMVRVMNDLRNAITGTHGEQAHQRGFDARMGGQDEDANPYDDHHSASRDWGFGWRAAQKVLDEQRYGRKYPSETFKEGYDYRSPWIYFKGEETKTLSDNPYEACTQENADWREGFRAAELEAKT